MFDDPKKELRRLQQQLLDEEDDSLDDMLADAHRLLGDDMPDEEAAPRSAVRGYPGGYGAAPRSRNTDPADVALDEYSDEIHDEPRKKGVKGLVILLCLELLGIAAVAVYWLLFLL